jgi:hypothetical protein
MSFAVRRALFRVSARYSTTLAGNWRRAADGGRRGNVIAAKRQTTPQATYCAPNGRLRKPRSMRRIKGVAHGSSTKYRVSIWRNPATMPAEIAT